MLDAESRIDCGAALLDQRVPGWADRVSLERFDIRSDRRCVLGQLYGDYDTGLHELGLYSGVGHGFDLRRSDVMVAPEPAALFAPLDAAWRAAIAARTTGAKP